MTNPEFVTLNGTPPPSLLPHAAPAAAAATRDNPAASSHTPPRHPLLSYPHDDDDKHQVGEVGCVGGGVVVMREFRAVNSRLPHSPSCGCGWHRVGPLLSVGGASTLNHRRSGARIHSPRTYAAFTRLLHLSPSTHDPYQRNVNLS